MANSFQDRGEFNQKAVALGLTPANCVYVAANMLIGPAPHGLDVSLVEQELKMLGNHPTEVKTEGDMEVDPMKVKTHIGCAACKMTVTVAGGWSDFQRVVVRNGQKQECPVFSQD